MNLDLSLNKGIPVGKSSAYVGITFDRVVTFQPRQCERKFRIVIYGAYNVFGLIGSEHNGIAILDLDNYRVVLDECQIMETGYHGPNAEVLATAAEICQMNWERFREFCNTNERTRRKI